MVSVKFMSAYMFLRKKILKFEEILEEDKRVSRVDTWGKKNLAIRNIPGRVTKVGSVWNVKGQ